MNRAAYRDGLIAGAEQRAQLSEDEIINGIIPSLERAICDCQEMGWAHLETYFRGKLDGVSKAE